MIVTLTANPSVDRTVTLTEPLRRGQVHRAASVTSHPGGKGVNVARVVSEGGGPVIAVLPGAEDDPVVHGLRTAGIEFRTVPVSGGPRVNLTIAETDGTTTKINEPGHPLKARDLAELTALLVELAAGAEWIVLSGSLPPGVPVDWYAQLVATLSALRVSPNGTRPTRVAVDTSDAPLLALFAESVGVAPDLIKPNSDELAQLTGLDPVDLENPTAAAEAAATLIDRGVGAVLATLGAAGAVLVTAEDAWFAAAPPIVARSTVGAGDSALAGYLLADLAGASPADRLRTAVAYGSAATALPGTELPGPADILLEAVTAHPLTAADRRPRHEHRRDHRSLLSPDAELPVRRLPRSFVAELPPLRFPCSFVDAADSRPDRTRELLRVPHLPDPHRPAPITRPTA